MIYQLGTTESVQVFTINVSEGYSFYLRRAIWFQRQNFASQLQASDGKDVDNVGSLLKSMAISSHSIMGASVQDLNSFCSRSFPSPHSPPPAN